jgi:hypothetical protein
MCHDDNIAALNRYSLLAFTDLFVQSYWPDLSLTCIHGISALKTQGSYRAVIYYC